MQVKEIQTKTCKNCSADFTITQKDKEFYDKISPVFNGKKHQIPTPTLCPDCRQQRRLAFRNERHLYKRKCDATGKEIISIYSPDKKVPVYHHTVWKSDSWDIKDYFVEYNPAEEFLLQFHRLLHIVPRPSLITVGCENSDYGNNNTNDKNCYLLFLTFWNQDCYYGSALWYSKDCIDTLWNIGSQNCYQCVKIEKCYNCFYCDNIKNSIDCLYISDSIGATSCMFSTNIYSKKYYVLNTFIGEEEYQKLYKKIQEDSELFQEYYKKYSILKLSNKKENHNTQIENSRGDYLSNCKNCTDCYDILQAQDCHFCYDSWNISNCYDVYHWGASFEKPASSFCYETDNCFSGMNVLFSSNCWYECRNLFYCDSCFNCQDCFGCVGLNHKRFHILNKAYSPEEYYQTLEKIIISMKLDESWGEFFSPSLSLFWYNETMAQDYYPLTKEEALQQWYNWSDYEVPFPKVDKIIPAYKLSNSIADIPDDILNWAIECEVSKKPFRIIPQELEFYRKHDLPIPKLHPEERHIQRMKLRNPRKLYERNCGNCRKTITTTYAPDRAEEVFCEDCYDKGIYR